jgi:VWFA-related protein
LVKGLSKDDFRIVEDGQPQEIQFVHPEDSPATVGLLIDNSGSMRRKRSDVIEAALAFAESSNPQDEIFIVNFNERVFMGLPAGLPFTSDINQLRAALANTRAEGKVLCMTRSTLASNTWRWERIRGRRWSFSATAAITLVGKTKAVSSQWRRYPMPPFTPSP